MTETGSVIEVKGPTSVIRIPVLRYPLGEEIFIQSGNANYPRYYAFFPVCELNDERATPVHVMTHKGLRAFATRRVLPLTLWADLTEFTWYGVEAPDWNREDVSLSWEDWGYSPYFMNGLGYRYKADDWFSEGYPDWWYQQYSLYMIWDWGNNRWEIHIGCRHIQIEEWPYLEHMDWVMKGSVNPKDPTGTFIEVISGRAYWSTPWWQEWFPMDPQWHGVITIKNASGA